MVRRFGLLTALLALLGASPALAQSVAVATLTGTVADQTGGALPGAEVTVAQTDTGLSRFVITNARGDFSFTNLPIGPYKLTAKLSGFTTFEQTGITLRVGDTRSVNVTLNVGAMANTVTVQADASLVQTQRRLLRPS